MKVAVIGSRTFGDYRLLKKYLDKLHSIKEITLIVSGGALGADKLGEQWANENKIPKSIIYPNWKLYGKRAGFLRNKEIINECEIIIAFWDKISKGTEHSINLAKEQNKKVYIVTFKNKE